MGHLEQANIDMMQAQAMIKKAEAGVGIANEQREIATFDVSRAQEGVAAVLAQIAAKKAEIADKSSLFSQMTDFFSGIGDAAKGMVPLAKGVMAEGGPVLLSASALDPAGITSLHDGTPTPTTLRFDVHRVPLSPQAAAAKLSNMAVYLVGLAGIPLPLTVGLANPATTIAASLTNGVELSNLGPLDDGQPPRPLNAVVGAPLAQTITVTIDKNGIADQLASVNDIGLWLEFSMPA
jgi:hypothetical protein